MGVSSSESHDLTAFYEMLTASFGVLSPKYWILSLLRQDCWDHARTLKSGTWRRVLQWTNIPPTPSHLFSLASQALPQSHRYWHLQHLTCWQTWEQKGEIGMSPTFLPLLFMWFFGADQTHKSSALNLGHETHLQCCYSHGAMDGFEDQCKSIYYSAQHQSHHALVSWIS